MTNTRARSRILACDLQCVDCGDVWDYYMVYVHVSKDARLDPNQCCSRKCPSVRLGRPLEYRGDFAPCFVNERLSVIPAIRTG